MMKKYLRKKAMPKLHALFSKSSILPHSILIFFDSSLPENEKMVTKWLRKHKETFSKSMIIGLDPKNPSPIATTFPIIGKKDITWYNTIKPQAVVRSMPDFLPYDLMVLNKKPLQAIDMLVQTIPAKLKISHKPILKSAYDVILDRDGADWNLLFREFDALMPKVELV